MRVALGRHPVGRPARVRDAERARQVRFVSAARELCDAAGAAQAVERAVDHGDAGGIVAAILEALQALEQDGNDVAPARWRRRCRTYQDSRFFCGRFQPEIVVCFTRESASSPAGTSRVTVVPAAMVAPAAHGDRGDELGVRADENIVFDDRAVLVRAVVVARDRARADVHVAPDRRIADVGQVVGLRPRRDVARLHLDEIADVNVFRETRAGPYARVRADAAALADRRVFHVTERLDTGARPDRHVLHDAVGADFDTVGELNFTFEYAVHVDAHVAPAAERAAHVDALRVGQRDAFVEELVRIFALVDALELSELRAAVHAQRPPRLGHPDSVDRNAIGERELHHVGQVILFLRVVVRKARKPAAKPRRRQRHQSGVDFAYAPLVVGRVFFFDDAADGAFRIARTMRP